MPTLPALFIGHGSPMNALERNRYTEVWRALAAGLPRPRAVLCISAHWLTQGLAITAMQRPRTIHDFGGFPQALFDLRYPAPGDVALAQKVAATLQPWPVVLDTAWGLDHGVWSVLTHLFPKADVPVLQLSLDATRPEASHYALGRKLAALRDEQVLILGSGNVVHNLRRLDFSSGKPADWATRFEAAVRRAIVERDHAALIDWQALGSDAALSVPTPEHYWPLLPVLGTQSADESAEIVVEGIETGSISMLSVRIG